MRVDDGDNERIYQEARAQDRKLQQLQGERRTDEGTAFDKAMAGRSQQQQRGQVVQNTKANVSRSAVQRAISTQKDTKGRNKPGKPSVQEAAEQGHLEGAQVEGHTETAKTADRSLMDRAAGTRTDQGKANDTHQATGQQARATGQLKQKDNEGVARQKDQKDEARTETGRADDLHQAEASGATAQTAGKVGGARGNKDQGGSGQGKDDQKPESFRLPPQALMAPPPLARPKDTGPPSRLRALAQEIADKIVKQVHIGTNKMGLPEFQIELKSDILKGLKVKVSGRHGRIRATFSSRDLQVIKQLKGEVARLREALTARGLKVDALDVEEERA